MAVIVNVLAAFVPAAVLYYVVNIRIQEIEKRFKRVEDGIDYVFEELTDLRSAPRFPFMSAGDSTTESVNTTPAVMTAAPAKKKRARKAK